MKKIFKAFTLLLFLILSGCGTGEIIKYANTNTYSVTSQYGSLNGSWARATGEATEKAIAYCDGMGKKYLFVNEQKTGLVGWSPQASTITFNCDADAASTASIVNNLQSDCKIEMQVNELDIIRTKVELFENANDSAPTFETATNTTYPNVDEKAAIAKWAKIREGCMSRENEAITTSQQPSNAMQRAFADKENGFRRQMTAQVSSLIVALYESKITYGEFSQKRYEMTSSVISAERDYRAVTLMRDRNSQVQAEQLAIQQQQNNINALSIYMQSVNARQPQIQQQILPQIQSPSTTRLQAICTTNKFGNILTTNCN